METRELHKPRLNVIGCGRVGQTLSRLWHLRESFAIQDVLTTSQDSARTACEWIGAGRPVAQLEDMRDAGVWMLAVPDAQLTGCARALASAIAPRNTSTPSVAFHCSGALAAAELAPLATLGWHVASAHCILSFASAPLALQQFGGTACALEGDTQAVALLGSSFAAIGAQCFAVAGQNKLLYHAAAVFATNFLPVLQATAEDLWRATGVPAELVPALRSSLLRNAVDNITAKGPQAALTGPAARGDMVAIARQASAVRAWNNSTGLAYEALSELALQLAQRGGLDTVGKAVR